MQLKTKFDKKELSLRMVLKKALGLVDPKKGPILEVFRNSRYNDEPMLYQYTARIKQFQKGCGSDTEETAGGTSFSKEKALMKALGEALERYCLTVYQETELLYLPINRIKEKSLDLFSIVSFSSEWVKSQKLKQFQVKNNTKLRWVEGYSLTEQRKLLIPAQLIYVPYNFNSEAIIRFPITTGAALGSALPAAILRGIFEIVERDAFMIFYLNKLTPAVFNLSNTSNLFFRMIREIFARYDLELYIFNITTDIFIPSIMAIIVDRTGIGPAVSVGLKSSLGAELAITGAIEEALQMRPWVRDEMMQRKSKTEQVLLYNLDIKTRALYWADLDMIEKLDFFLKSKNYIEVDKFIEGNKGLKNKDLQSIINFFTKKDLHVVYTDITTPEIRNVGFYVVKVVMPELQPLYLTEEYKYLGGARLFQVPRILGYKATPKHERELNKTPHPFL